MTWETIWSGGSEAEAEVVAGSLRQDGFEAQILPTMAHSPYPGAQQGRWDIAVPAADAARARRYLANRGEEASLQSEGPRQIDWPTHLKAGAIAVALMLGIAAYLALLGDRGALP